MTFFISFNFVKIMTQNFVKLFPAEIMLVKDPERIPHNISL